MKEGDSAETNSDDEAEAPRSSDARATRDNASAAKAAAIRARTQAEAQRLKPMIETLEEMKAEAAAAGDRETVANATLALLATQRGDHIAADRLMTRILEALRPKPSPDQQERLIAAVVSLGLDTCMECVKRARANARRK